MSTVAEHTVPEMILLAAFELDQQGQSPFSAEALIVASWQKFPQSFGLKGYSDQFPDSNKVLSSIMGEKGLARRGWLSKMGQKLYSITREGRGVVNRMLQLEDDAPPEPPQRKITREKEKFLLALLDTSAVQKFQENRRQELTFADACKFWNINETLHGEQLDGRFDRLRAELSDFDRLVESDEVVLSNGRSISQEDMQLLHKTHKHLEERFARHVNLLRNRTARN